MSRNFFSGAGIGSLGVNGLRRADYSRLQNNEFNPNLAPPFYDQWAADQILQRYLGVTTIGSNVTATVETASDSVAAETITSTATAVVETAAASVAAETITSTATASVETAADWAGATSSAVVVVPPVSTTPETSGVAGGGRVPIERVPARRRAKVKPLPYWVGLEVRFAGPPMPQLGLTASWEAPSAPVEAPKARVVYTPRPKLPEAPPAWTPAPQRPVVRASLALQGVSLPQFAMVMKTRDRHSEMALLLLASVQAYD